jgi:epoxyqueuosine reductase
MADRLAALAAGLKAQALAEGFALAGLASAAGSPRLQLRSEALERWLAAGHAAGMGWMHDPRRRQLQALLPGAASLLLVALDYSRPERQQPQAPRIARYGWGRDYHRVIDGRLRRLGRWLQQHQADCRWRVCVDAAPLMEKAWAEEAGLGWIGKHGNLIHHRRGSWLLLGALITDLPLPADTPARPRCGSCSRCLPACPTGAIREPFVVDSRRCIAYHTIENRDPTLPTAISAQLQGWVAGCDLCQEACPWNQDLAPAPDDSACRPRDWILSTDGATLLTWDDGRWDNALRASALRRIRPWMWRRNLQAAAGTTADSP